MRTYAQMKDSGIDWIGEVPSHWALHTLYQLVSQVKSKNKDLSEKNLLSLSYGKVKRKNIEGTEGLLPESFDGYSIIEDGDVVLRLTDLQNDHTSLRVGLATERGIITSAYITVRPAEGCVSKYLYYLLHTFDIRKGFYGMGSGVRQGLNYDEVKELRVTLPSEEEQQAIAAYLDEQCALIDGAIADAKASIEEYKVWKASIIYKTIIKGVTGEENLKYSGIDWLGEVVPNRTICKLKYLCSNITDGSHFSPISIDVGVPYITAKDVHGIGIDFESTNKISETDYRKLRDSGCQPEKGDVLMVKDGATTGRVGLMSSDTACVVLSSVSILRPKADVLSKYLMYLLESEVLQRQIKLSMGGSAMPRITLTKIVDYVAIMCPYEEQTKIVTYLDERCESIDEIINRKQSLVVDLESYKRSLIYEVVTGKRKVVQ